MDLPNEKPKTHNFRKEHGKVSKKLTSYSRPSLTTLMTRCLDMDTLEGFYKKITTDAKDASTKTLRVWKDCYEQQKRAIEAGETKAELQMLEEQRMKAVEPNETQPATD